MHNLSSRGLAPILRQVKKDNTKEVYEHFSYFSRRAKGEDSDLVPHTWSALETVKDFLPMPMTRTEYKRIGQDRMGQDGRGTRE